MAVVDSELELGPVAFDSYILDPVKRTLKRNGEAVPLTAKAFDVLVVLVEGRGRVVGKDELMSRVWADTVVEENNLVRHVSMLRKALNDPVGEHRYIVTVPGRGYSFVADVRPIAEVDRAAPPASPDRGVERADDERETAVSVATREHIDLPASVQEPPAGALQGWQIQSGPIRLLPIGIVLTGVLVALAWALWPGSAGHATTRRLFQVTFDARVAHDPVWSPDGTALAYASDRAGQSDIWVQRIGGGPPVRITDSMESDAQPDWSPDGRSIVFRSSRDGGGLFLVSAEGGAVRKLTDFGYRPRWSPDGTRLLFLSTAFDRLREAPTVYVMALDGTPPRPILGDLLRQMAWPRIAWHPSGRVSVWGEHATEGWGLWTVDLDGGTMQRSEADPRVKQAFLEAGVRFGDFVWSPAGDAIFFEGTALGVTSLWRVRVDPVTLRVTAGPERLTTSADRNREIALSNDGKRLAFVSLRDSARLWSWPLKAGSEPLEGGAPLFDRLNVGSPELSNDGTLLAYRARQGDREEMVVRNIATGEERLIYGGKDSVNDGRFSPDGRTLAYLRVENAPFNAPTVGTVVLRSLETDEERLLVTPGSGVTVSDWSPDGQFILGRCPAPMESRTRLCTFPVAAAPHAEREARVVAEDPDLNLWQGRYSPDGRWVLFNAISPGKGSVSTLYVAPSGGGAWTRLSEGEFFDDKGRWSADGRRVYFVSNRDGHLNIWARSVDPATGQPQGAAFQITHFERDDRLVAPEIAELDIAVSADRLILPLVDLTSDVWVLEDVDRRAVSLFAVGAAPVMGARPHLETTSPCVAVSARQPVVVGEL